MGFYRYCLSVCMHIIVVPAASLPRTTLLLVPLFLHRALALVSVHVLGFPLVLAIVREVIIHE